MSEFGQDLIIRAKLVLPRPRRYLLRRPALSARLLEAQHYRLTVVQAGTGYGKSTALVSALQEAPLDVFWYSLAESDRDARLFLLHLAHAFQARFPELGSLALAMLQAPGTNSVSYPAVIDALSNELMDHLTREAVLVLDDYHLVNPASEVNMLVNHFIQILPPNLHLIIATRHRPLLKMLTQWRVKGDLFEITQQDLAFSSDEIDALFRTQYGLVLDARQVQRLAIETEGWAIALHMIWQGLQSGVAGSLDQILEELPRSLEDLFVYLAQEVLARRPAHIQDFLLQTSILRQLDPAACDHLMRWDKSKVLLDELDQEAFFLVRLGDAYRYHYLFHDFLRQQLSLSDQHQARRLHRRAADFYQQKGNSEETIHHLLAAAEYKPAAETMVQLAESMVQSGRFDTMNEWVISLPPDVLEQFPALMYHLGELCRFASHFDEALAWYEHAKERHLQQRDIAGASRALRGQAAVYLDTVRPIKAETLLQQALRLIDGQPDREERARLLNLLAENMTNRGKWEEAEALRRQARGLLQEGPSLADLDVRVLLRTGRLAEARAILEERAAEERRRTDSFREPRGHRETLLVLSLIYAFQGRPDQAFACAREGIEIGRQLKSPFVEAVGYMRLGHAWQISNRPESFDQALSCYQRAIEIGEQLAVPRTKVEAMWGLCRLHGYNGNLALAEQIACEGREIGLAAGDEWIAALIDLALGASYVIAGQDNQAFHWLNKSAKTFRDCGDPFGQAASLLWQCVLYQKHGATELPARLSELLAIAQKHAYEFLFDRPAFLGSADPATPAPLLVAGRHIKTCAAYAATLLARLRLPPDLEFHPGYTLRVQTLGQFAVWRGRQAVDDNEWKREKARQLFQLLLVNRGRLMERDEIAARLWPETDSATTLNQQFKVTLNALQQVLEPGRPSRVASLFVQRLGSAYCLNPDAPLWLDVAIFEQLVEQGSKASDEPAALDLYRQAVALYKGDLLPACIYEDWCQGQREHVRQLYLSTASKIAAASLAQGDADAAISLCTQILAIDNCYEAAYQWLIRAYLHKRDFVQARRTYERCVACLKEELEMAPMPETTALYKETRQAA